MGGKAVEKYGVGNGVEGCREIQQDQETDAAHVSSHEEIVCNHGQCGLSAVVGSVARL